MKTLHELVAPSTDAFERVVADALAEYREEILHAVEECQRPDDGSSFNAGYITAYAKIIAAIKRVTVTP